MAKALSFEALVEAHSPELFAYLWRQTRDTQEAEDCLQEAFLRAYRAYPRLESGANCRAWLYAIATNVARTHLRRKRRSAARTADLDPESLQADPDDLDGVDRQRTLAAVAGAVEALPHKQRAALLMRKYQGLGYAEIASALGCSQDAARANVYQALKKGRARFEDCSEGRLEAR
jgi:RNA polymerase sigma-70 factor (ECF subfamily)